MPKSASVLAYVGGDERILEANQKAVKAAMAWVEENVAEARVYSRDAKNGDPVRTGNLVYAMFQHDTSRLLDPQAHIHVVVAAITQMADGAWKALWNGEIYKHNSVIGSIYHAALRSELEQLGYARNPPASMGSSRSRACPNPCLRPIASVGRRSSPRPTNSASTHRQACGRFPNGRAMTRWWSRTTMAEAGMDREDRRSRL
jgi:hypothetical protein